MSAQHKTIEDAISHALTIRDGAALLICENSGDMASPLTVIWPGEDDREVTQWQAADRSVCREWMRADWPDLAIIEVDGWYDSDSGQFRFQVGE